MIQAIMKIGKRTKEKDETTDPLNNFVQNPNEKGNIQKVITISLVQQDNVWIYKDVEIEEFKEKYVPKYLYRFGSGRGADLTPTSKFAGDMKKTFKNKILASLKNIEKQGKSLGFDSNDQKKIKQIFKALSDSETLIINRLTERAEELGKKEGAILTLVFSENSGKKYIGDIHIFRNVLKDKAKETYFKQYNKQSIGYDQKCYVCQHKQSEVYGFVNTYNFYTLDKPGFVTGGFRQQDAWKNYPSCFDCATTLELGKNYLNKKLRFKFYGFDYLLIPKFFSEKIMEEVFDILEYSFKHRSGEATETKFDKKYISRLTDAEDEIFDLISEQKDYVGFDLLFYREKQSAFNILLHIEDILPSRFKKLFDVKIRIDETDIFKREISKEGKRLLVFNFRILRNFFPYISKTRTYNKHFLELVEKIFSLKLIDYNFTLKAIVRKLRTKFVNDEYLKTDCLAGYLLLNYLAGLGILSKGGKQMDIEPIEDLKNSFDSENVSTSEKIKLFFESHGNFFDNPQKKACFLVGILIQKLLNIQWIDKNATPFRAKLYGLRLTEHLLKRISYEAQEKLEQYGKNYYRELESVIAQYMVAAGTDWKITNDEISFYFSVGMNLASLFKTKKEKEREEEKDDQP